MPLDNHHKNGAWYYPGQQLMKYIRGGKHPLKVLQD